MLLPEFQNIAREHAVGDNVIIDCLECPARFLVQTKTPRGNLQLAKVVSHLQTHVHQPEDLT